MRPVLIVHGGAGAVPEERRPLHAAGCRDAADRGFEVLADGGRAIDAAIRACEALENDPLFNAGTGACLTSEGTLELDASVMDGEHLEMGAVACLPPFANPILVADAVRRDGVHTMYAGEGGALFAARAGLLPVDPEVLITDAARARLEMVLAGRAERTWAGGTVGAVAFDREGHVAAATSTGGSVGKAPGRVGDTPLVGAGTWADDELGGCSTTGVGEHIMRFGLARHACERLRNADANAAATLAIEDFGRRISGRGGLILVDREGRAAYARNSDSMSWAIARRGDDTRFGF